VLYSPRVMDTQVDTCSSSLGCGGPSRHQLMGSMESRGGSRSYCTSRVRRRLSTRTRLRSTPPISSKNPLPIATRTGRRYTIVK
jgi:hypothetical protein